ncbi:aromatic amino acid transport family protein [Candidatus Omnitrophota bacterium]
MLGLPIQAGFSGFIPCLVSIVLVGVALFYTTVVLGEEVIRTKKPIFHYPSLYHEYLGPTGRWIAVVANLVIFYGFLIVYLSGASTIIKDLLNVPISGKLITLIFFVVITGLTVMNPRILREYTAVFVVLLLVSFAVLIAIGKKYIVPGRLEYMNWSFFSFTVPVLITALSFHNIIPNVCKDLGWRRSSVMISMVIGAIVGYIITALWVQVTLGVLPLNGAASIYNAYQNNLPSTVPLSQIIQSPMFINFALAFALLAIVTSYLTNGYGLMEFMDDLLTNYFKRSNKLLVILLSFVPPLIITLVYPSIFLMALEFVGGYGVAVLFGLLPCVIAVMRARASGKTPLLGIIMFMVFMAFIFCKFAKDTGIIKYEPGVRYVRYNFKHYVSRQPLALDQSQYKKQHSDGK